LFLFQVPSLRRNFSPAAGSPWGRENADQHPSLLPQHCTLASNVKARGSNVSNFLSSKLLAEKRRERIAWAKSFSRRGEQNVLHRGAKIEFVRIANVKAARAALPSRAFAQISRPRYDVARHIRRTDVTL